MPVEYPDDPDLIDTLLHEKFARRHKVVIDGDRGVITAADAGFFVGVQLLYYSLALSHEIKFAVFDLGFTAEQRAWCEGQGIILLEPPAPIFGDGDMWQSWNKPSYIAASPFEQTLWLDSDTLVRGSLEVPFDILSRQPFMVECAHQQQGFLDCNDADLYKAKRLHIPKDQLATIIPNAGVLGFRRGRDSRLLESWTWAVRFARDNPVSRRFYRWHDQGALIWSLEKTRNLELVLRGAECFNFPTMAAGKWGFVSPSAFLSAIPYADPSVVRHFVGPSKPWSMWGDGVILDTRGSFGERVCVLALSHGVRATETLHARSYLLPTRLDLLDIGEHQVNEIAESRIYLDPGLMDKFGDSEYVGLASAQWNYKYHWHQMHKGLPPLHGLHALKPRPDLVLVADPVGEEWVGIHTAGNLGIDHLLGELADFTGMPLYDGPTFWANNYICHRDVMIEYVAHFRRVYAHFHGKYKNRFSFVGVDSRRTPAYFYEAITIQYFSNRTDLEIRPMISRTKV